jgi:hypothetical protein
MLLAAPQLPHWGKIINAAKKMGFCFSVYIKPLEI